MNLNHKITIERRGTAQDDTGQERPTWGTVAQTWASIRPISGREYFNASGPRAEVSHEIILRFGPSVKPRDRIVYNGRVFDVQSVLNLEERNRYLKLMSIENADQGI